MFKPKAYIGIDVGGTKILGLITDGRSATSLERIKRPTPKDPSKVGSAILDVVKELLDAEQSLAIKVRAVGVGVPGLVDKTGVLRYGPNVQGVLNLNIAEMITEKFGHKAVAENDGYLATLVEARIGAAQGHRNAILITQGTGIGAGIIIDGKLVKGANGFAGEPGHMVIDPKGPTCACKKQGCWEALSSGAGLANVARLFVKQGRAKNILQAAGGSELIRGEHVSEALIQGDPDALAIFDKFAWWVAQGLANLATLLDPSIIVLGGGLAAVNKEFINQVKNYLPERLMGSKYRPEVEITTAEYGEDAGAIGAGLRARDFAINAI